VNDNNTKFIDDAIRKVMCKFVYLGSELRHLTTIQSTVKVLKDKQKEMYEKFNELHFVEERTRELYPEYVGFFDLLIKGHR